MGAMLRTYQITMGRAYYKCTLRFSSTSNVTDTDPGSQVAEKPEYKRLCLAAALSGNTHPTTFEALELHIYYKIIRFSVVVVNRA